MSNRLVCICNLVDEKEINRLLNGGADSVKDIQNLTRAGTSCGRCLPVIDEIIAIHQKEKPKDQQKKLNLGF